MENIRYEIIRKHPNYIISSDGRIWDKVNNKECEYTTNSLGLKSAIIDGEILSLDLQLLLAFKHNEEGYLIKYKDGDRNNISLDNLYWDVSEWDIEGEEDKHNLPDKRRPILLLDENGKIIDSCDSLYECGKIYDIWINNIVYSAEHRSYNKVIGAFVSFVEDYDEELIEDIKEYGRNNFYWVVTLNGDIKMYCTVKDIEKDYPQMKDVNVAEITSRIRYSKMIDGYIVRHKHIDIARQNAEKKKITLANKIKRMDKNNKAIYLLDKEYNIIGEYERLSKLSKEYKYNTTLYVNLSSHKWIRKLNCYIVYQKEWNEDKERIISQIEMNNK